MDDRYQAQMLKDHVARIYFYNELLRGKVGTHPKIQAVRRKLAEIMQLLDDFQRDGKESESE